MNKITKAALVGLVGVSVTFGTAEAGRQKSEWFDCGELVTNGVHWGYECTSPLPTVVPTVAPTVAPTPVVTPAPTVEATPVATVVPTPVATPVTKQDTPPGANVAGCWVNGCAHVSPTPAVFVATPIPNLVPASPIQEPVQFAPVFVPQPPKAGSGGYLEDTAKGLRGFRVPLLIVAACAAIGAGYITGRK